MTTQINYKPKKIFLNPGNIYFVEGQWGDEASRCLLQLNKDLSCCISSSDHSQNSSSIKPLVQD